MEEIEKNEEYYFSSQTEKEFYWFQNNTGNVTFENAFHCVDKNHYITQPNWVICEICNCIIQNNDNQ